MEFDLDACIRGDKRAWDAFVEQYSGLIVAAVRRTIRGPGSGGATIEPDDPVQEVFVRLVKDDYRLLRSFDPNRASISTWLTMVSRSVTIDHLRRRRISTAPIDAQPDVAAPENASPAGDAVGGPDLPLHLLSARQRLVLRLLFDRDMTTSDVASFLEVDEQTVRSTKHKALRKLREALGADAARPGRSGDSRG